MTIARRTLLAGAGLALGGRAAAAEPDTVNYPAMEVQRDVQAGYMVALLEMALARSGPAGRSYRLQQRPSANVQARTLLELARPDSPIDVFWTMTDSAREAQLLPVRIPIDRGLIGWRIALVKRAELQRWQGLRSLAELARYHAGQMHDWPDTAILRANGLSVHTSPSYQGLFDMLALGRIDYFPRSLLEIEGELQAHRQLDLVIEPHLLLHYPAAMYYFVTPSRPQLAAAIERGLEALLADGGLEQLFRRQFGGVLSRLGLERRTVLRLRNPVLPGATPLARAGLWWTP